MGTEEIWSVTIESLEGPQAFTYETEDSKSRMLGKEDNVVEFVRRWTYKYCLGEGHIFVCQEPGPELKHRATNLERGIQDGALGHAMVRKLVDRSSQEVN